MNIKEIREQSFRDRLIEKLKVIGNQTKVNNQIQILDRLLEHGAIDTENYIEELQKLYIV